MVKYNYEEENYHKLNKNNITSKLKNTRLMFKSNYIHYIIISIITFSLITMVILSYFFTTNFIYEYVILGVLLIYILYYLYNL